MKKILWGFPVIIVVLIATVFVRTITFGSVQIRSEPVPPLPVNLDQANQRLADALGFPTISFEDTLDINYDPFLKFHDYLKTSYPSVQAALERKTINRYSLLYTWHGSNPDLKPILLMAHIDVVPVTPETIEQWEQLPFAGNSDDTFIWGRGALDDKTSLLSLLEAVEFLLKENFQPQRTVLIAFGHDEEIGGKNGARQTAAYLRSKNIHPEFILDEGGVVITGGFPGVEAPVALVGIAEKGFVSLEFSTTGVGGHSSMPPAKSAIGALSAALYKLEANPLPAEISGPVKYLFTALAPEMGFPQRMAFANLWLFGGMVENMLSSLPTTNALIRTTTALTLFHSGVKENVLPTDASAVVNFRIKPGDTLEKVRKHVIAVIDDPQVDIQIHGEDVQEASPVSDIKAESYQVLATTIRQVFPEAVVAPWLTVGATDTKYFTDLSDNIYRFLPLFINNEDVARFHGINERVAKESYHKSITFYAQLIKNATR